MIILTYPLGQTRLRQRRLNRQSLKPPSEGFTLLEILIVLVLLGLIISMLPSGLLALNTKADYQMSVQKVVIAARQCSITAQQQQRSISLGSEACPLPSGTDKLTITAESLPLFHADGTASHSARIVIEPAKDSSIDPAKGSSIDPAKGSLVDTATGSNHPVTVVMIDKLTANVTLKIDEPY